MREYDKVVLEFAETVFVEALTEFRKVDPETALSTDRA
jgi:hypothetical protein